MFNIGPLHMQGLTERLGFFASLLNNKGQLLTVF